MKRRFRTYSELEGSDRSGLAEQIAAQTSRVTLRLSGVDRTVAVLSGKGGVGKSLVSSALATVLADEGHAVGLLDADLHSPTAAGMCGAAAGRLAVLEDAVQPVVAPTGVAVMSMQLLLEEDAPLKRRGPSAAGFVWEGAEDHRALREFLSDVAWGSLDWLLIDLPPGTRRMVDLFELVPGLTGVVAVTVPAAVAGASAERALRIVAERDIPILGIVENMSGYQCSGCHARRPLFHGGAGERLAAEFGAPLLGTVPFDPEAARYADDGDLASLVRSTACGAAIRQVAGVLATRAKVRAGEGERA